jgi:chemotaxis protein CheD
MAHILLPTPSLAKAGASPQKFPETAIPYVLEEMTALGANSQRVTARVVGGAAMFSSMVPTGSIQMGERNLVACRKALNVHNIPVVGEAVGGKFGRSVHFHIDTGVVSISSVKAGVHQI